MTEYERRAVLFPAIRSIVYQHGQCCGTRHEEHSARTLEKQSSGRRIRIAFISRWVLRQSINKASCIAGPSIRLSLLLSVVLVRVGATSPSLYLERVVSRQSRARVKGNLLPPLSRKPRQGRLDSRVGEIQAAISWLVASGLGRM